MKTRLTQKLGIEHPVLLAPMGRWAGGRLAAAVSRAGGLGILGGGYGDRAWLEAEYAAAAGERIGCGFITWSLARQPALMDYVLAQRPAAVMFSFGDPSPFLDAVRRTGTPVICQVQDMETARQALEYAPDVVVAEGTEAGGHSRLRTTFTLVPEVADLLARRAPDTVLVAAGGVADGRGLAAALMLGADGVLVGSRFGVTQESAVADGLKRAVVAADGDATRRTTVPDLARGYHWPVDFDVRVLKTAFVEEWHGREAAMREPGAQAAASERFWDGFNAGRADDTCILTGQGAGLTHDIPPAGELLRRMVQEAQALLARGPRA